MFLGQNGEVENEWLLAAEATARLGVKPQTLYAYVSRGLVRSERVPGTRVSRFRRDDVERLAQRARRTTPPGRLDVVIDTELTLLDPDGYLAYRGWDVVEAAASATYEDVAEWLWTAQRGPAPEWVAPAAALRVGSAVQRALPPTATVPDRIRVIVSATATADALRYDRRPEAVVVTARTLIASLVDSLPMVEGAAEPRGRSVAARLWPRLTATGATPARVRALDAALVLLADHELAASALAARVAASTWADPYLVVAAGLAAAGGPLHGGASAAVRTLLAQVQRPMAADAAVGEILRRGELVPGFGHRVYEVPDPRAVALLGAVARMQPPLTVQRAATDILAVMASRGGPDMNVDFALAVFSEACDMVPDAGEAIFEIARCAGLIAHGLEEYRHRLRYRPRAAYVGPPLAPDPVNPAGRAARARSAGRGAGTTRTR
jgi:citrate synthase